MVCRCCCAPCVARLFGLEIAELATAEPGSDTVDDCASLDSAVSLRISAVVPKRMRLYLKKALLLGSGLHYKLAGLAIGASATVEASGGAGQRSPDI